MDEPGWNDVNKNTKKPITQRITPSKGIRLLILDVLFGFNLHKLLNGDNPRRSQLAYDDLERAYKLQQGIKAAKGSYQLKQDEVDLIANVEKRLLLDSVAVACVEIMQEKDASKPPKQTVVAVAGTFNDEKNTVELRLSQNESVTPDTVDFLKNLWNSLVVLRKGTKENVKMKNEFFRALYSRGWVKFHYRITSPISKSKFKGALDQLKTEIVKNGVGKESNDEIEKLIKKFLEIKTATEEMTGALEEKTKEKLDVIIGHVDELWKELRKYEKWEALENKVEKLTTVSAKSNKAPLDKTEKPGSFTEKPRFYKTKLFSYLEKLCSLQVAGEALFRLASTPSCTLFDLALTVTKEEAYQVDSPELSKLTSGEDLMELIQIVSKPATPNFLDVSEMLPDGPWVSEKDGFQVNICKKDINEKLAKARAKCRPHAECKLLVTAMGKQDMFEYIGVSKLSCFACQKYFDAWNSYPPSKFCTRGSHGKLYLPWASPSTAAKPAVNSKLASVDTALSKLLDTDTQKAVKEPNKYYTNENETLTDSTVLTLTTLVDLELAVIGDKKAV